MEMTEKIPSFCIQCRHLFLGYELEYYDYPEDCPDCDDTLIWFDKTDIDILERINDPIENDEWEDDAITEIECLREDKKMLRAVLKLAGNTLANAMPLSDGEKFDDTQAFIATILQETK